MEAEALNATGAATYGWFKHDIALQDESTSRYQIASVVAEDAGYCQCEVADESKFMASSPTITLVVLYGLPVAAPFKLFLIAALSAFMGVKMLCKEASVRGSRIG